MARRRNTTAVETAITPEPAPAPRRKARKARGAAAPAKESAAKRARKQAARGTAASADEEAACIATLEANEQIAPEGAKLERGQTHQMVRQPDGTLAPVRKRFSAL
ncbi:MAG: hypothetical protein U5K74_15695 [Gemmatimonadaceae bacterium]|nr:hypothetical protein [Gemmatimonadaceae bacterium]